MSYLSAAQPLENKMTRAVVLAVIAFAVGCACASADDARKPVTIVECVKRPSALCERTCSTWAQSQPDYRFSLDICVSKCLKGYCFNNFFIDGSR
jgi:hypothetical protein